MLQEPPKFNVGLTVTTTFVQDGSLMGDIHNAVLLQSFTGTCTGRRLKCKLKFLNIIYRIHIIYTEKVLSQWTTNTVYFSTNVWRV